MNPQNPDPSQPAHNYNAPLSAMRQGENVIFDLRRHPIGIIGMYVSFVILLIVVGAVALIAPGIMEDYDQTLISNIGLAAFIISAVFSGIFAAIAHKVYYGNRWILTDDSITQINQRGLFSNQNSQLGLDNLEDVTVDQRGIMSHMFNYGVLKAQTAGEHSKFQFIYCPNPNDYAQKILMAREAFEHGNMYSAPTGTDSNAPR
jgi:hypothetical protein